MARPFSVSKKLLPVGILLASVVLAQQSAREQVQKLLDDQVTAWNRGDLDGFMQGYSKSKDLTFFSGDTIETGWEATLARYRRTYQSEGKEMGQLSFTDSTLELLGPDAALFAARWHLLMRNGSKREGLTTVICKRTKEGWKIVHDHSS
jgi:beta-aspartyl-peptidase (threonine type)